MISDEELKKIINGFSDIQIDGYIYHLPELEKWLKKQGHFKGEMALIGLLLLIKYKDDCIKLNKLGEDMTNLIIRSEELINKLKK